MLRSNQCQQTPQRASGAVREPILRRSALHDRETGVSLTMALIPTPFPHSLGHERLGGASCRSSNVRNAPLATVGPKKAAYR